MESSLSPTQCIYEIKQEFLEESEAFKRHRSPIEDKVLINHINALLDAYWQITQDIAYANNEGMGSE